MFLAEKFQEEKTLTWEDFQPPRLVSLWDMLKFNADLFVSVCRMLDDLCRPLDELAEGQSRGMRVGNALIGHFAIFKPKVLEIRDALKTMGLRMSVITTDKMIKFLDSKKEEPPLNELRQLMDKLSERIADELKSKWAFMIRNDRDVYYDMPGTFCGEEVIERLSTLREDASEAGNCFALGCYTACVFHLMRMMEFVVQKFGQRIGIKNLHKKTWGQVLSEIKSSPKLKIDKTDSPKIDVKKQRYLNYYALLDAVCRAVRNPTMHSKITQINRSYSEKEAKDLMDRVKSFIADFAILR